MCAMAVQGGFFLEGEKEFRWHFLKSGNLPKCRRLLPERGDINGIAWLNAISNIACIQVKKTALAIWRFWLPAILLWFGVFSIDSENPAYTSLIFAGFNKISCNFEFFCSILQLNTIKIKPIKVKLNGTVKIKFSMVKFCYNGYI